MKKALLSIGIAFLGASSQVSADQPNIAPPQPVDGVYFMDGWHTTVIELKDGKFRYWFKSDMKGGDVEELEGTYASEGDKILLKHPKIILLESNWTVHRLNGVVTLWRSDGLSLRSSKRTAEVTWKSPQLAGLSEPEYIAFTERRKREAILIREAEQVVAPNRSLPPSQKSISPARGSED